MRQHWLIPANGLRRSLSADGRLTLTGRKDIVLHDRDATGKAVLIAQPFKDPLRRMPLLLVNKPVRLKNLVDNADKGIELRAGRCLLAAIARQITP